MSVREELEPQYHDQVVGQPNLALIQLTSHVTITAEQSALPTTRKCEEEMHVILWREFEARERIFQDRDAVLQQREIAVADGEKRLAAAKELFEERAKNMGKNSTGPKASARRSTHSHPTAQFSPMKSVVLTATGEALATQSPVDLAVMFDLRKSEDEADDKDRDLVMQVL
ncbi:hypothetical protein B0H13DRAFT_1917590 [Mycena leptocephala]|nr:hypothetical protein B0H13DRAFT_1917590 [Mycena leptocephala]